MYQPFTLIFFMFVLCICFVNFNSISSMKDRKFYSNIIIQSTNSNQLGFSVHTNFSTTKILPLLLMLQLVFLLTSTPCFYFYHSACSLYMFITVHYFLKIAVLNFFSHFIIVFIAFLCQFRVEYHASLFQNFHLKVKIFLIRIFNLHYLYKQNLLTCWSCSVML